MKKYWSMSTIIKLARVMKDIEDKLSEDEQMAEIVWDDYSPYLSDRVQEIIDEHDVSDELLLHYVYDNDEAYDDLREQVEYVVTMWKDMQNAIGGYKNE